MRPAVAAFGDICTGRLLETDAEVFPALAEDMEGALEVDFVSEVKGILMTLAPVVNILAAPAPTSHIPPPMASSALL